MPNPGIAWSPSSTRALAETRRRSPSGRSSPRRNDSKPTASPPQRPVNVSFDFDDDDDDRDSQPLWRRRQKPPAAVASLDRSFSTSITTKDRDSAPASFSAGSTASIDSFAPYPDVDRASPSSPFWFQAGGFDAAPFASSSSPVDPYLSDRRGPPSRAPASAVTPAAPTALPRGGGARSRADEAVLLPPGIGTRRNSQDDDRSFRLEQERIRKQLQNLCLLDEEEEVDSSSAAGSPGSHFPIYSELQSSFFTAESLLADDPAAARSSSPSSSDSARKSRRGGGTDESTRPPPKYLDGIPTPVVRRAEQRGRGGPLAPSGGSICDDYHGRLSLSSASTADAGARSLASRSDSERDRRAIQSVLHWRNIVSLRTQSSPRWTTSTAAEGPRSPSRPSLAAARAHLSLGEALLGIQDYPEAGKSFQAAYRIFSAHDDDIARRGGPSRHALGLALCMERMGVATALGAEAAAAEPAVPSAAHADAPGWQPHASPRRTNFWSAGGVELEEENRVVPPLFPLLARAYTVHLEAFRLRSVHLGPHHVDAISSLNLIAKLHGRNRDWLEAQRCLWQVYWARVSVFGENHPSCAVTAHDVANVFCHLGLFEDALNFYSIASHVYDTLELPPHNPAVKKLRRDMERLERLEQKMGYNVL